MLPKTNNVLIFDTTMRDGELTPGVTMNVQDKIRLAQLLEAIGVDVIEVGYPGRYSKDFDEIVEVSKHVKNSVICGLAGSDADEITAVAKALKSANKARIHTYNNVHFKSYDKLSEEKCLATIQSSVSLARHYCDDVEWSAFDATRSQPYFLCKAIEMAIESGATTINIPDSLGLTLPQEFSQLIQMIFNQVSHIDQAVVSVHCHNDLGKAVENSIAALQCGARQIECAINGLGARKGNADLAQVVKAILHKDIYQIEIDTSLMEQASALVQEGRRLLSWRQEVRKLVE